ncbi:uncharacterized protein NPIL_597101 [Nephila pilipes]|uniref:Uncharacterized protein n=1 Tax=Nephila pilipes TaxID=299642 RepID=A0A8X6T376_NEPPI|nr:uncharacterized protein NPIL_597101 [Nephila pilipes]
MDVRFWPPLQLLAYARAALGILYTFDSETLASNSYMEQVKEKISTIRIPVFESSYSHIASELTNSTDHQNYLPLPSKIQTKMTHIALELLVEINEWFFINEDSLLIYETDFHLRDILSWRSSGVIDRTETARGLIRNETLNIIHRFLFACEYYFEEDAQKLWTNMLECDRLEFRKKWQNNEDKRHWLSALENRTTLDWEQITLNARDNEFFITNRKGIPYFLTRVQDKEIRYECIVSCLEILAMVLSPLDLYFCLFQLKANELNDVFTRLPKDLLHNVFESFLYWPLQIIFLDMVNSLKPYINGEIFCSLTCLLLDKLECRWQDYEYEELLKDLWKILSSQYGRFIEKHKILNKIVNYVLNSPVPFNIGDFKNFISDVREKEIKKIDGVDRTFLENFNPWYIQT